MTEVKKQIVGVNTDDFTDGVWAGVAEAYVRSAYNLSDDDIVGPNSWYYHTAADILSGYGEYRLGSVISVHSKLWICNFPEDKLHFLFDANADPHEKAYTERTLGVTLETISTDFQRRISSFLGELGVAQTVECQIHSR